MSIVCKKYPNAKLYMVGDGTLLQACINLSKYLDLENNIVFCNVLTPDEVGDLMSRCRVFIQHSIQAISGDKEGTPVAIMEAQASGKPVISTIHAGIPDIVIHNSTGYLVEENDIQSMAEFIMKLLESKDLAIEMGEKGRNNILENFTLKIHSEKLNNLINQYI